MNAAVPRRPADEAERRELAALLPPPPVPDLPCERGRLLKQAVLWHALRAGPARRPRGLRLRVLVPLVACVVTVAGVVVVSGERSADGDHQAAPTAQLLDRIALAAGARTPAAIRPEQFVYVESKVAYAGQSADGGPLALSSVRTRQVWLSADGSRAGLVREDGRPDSQVVDASSSAPSVSDPSHTFVASLPTDPDALLALIREQTRGQGQDPDQRAFEAIGELLAETAAPPHVSAALYRAAAEIPGVTMAGTAKDAAGRAGVTIARTTHGRQKQWIFDRTTYVFLGVRTVLVDDRAGPAGTVVGTSAILTTAAADRAGEAPATR
ncbi:CU044_5270 family protein [Streptomyces sp. TRM49041]|uniref:CU044_5270 family protein n=1 Tax=Streptomyces sp. TRM49041 TaxID=2603216 RepID=UPI0016568473|nr:CU044_5270 family protein [Streptomyces sp. TRM49041]